MSQYLLAAEADKIQDFLFRSSKLREVVGGSQLLTRFCQEAAEKLMQKRNFPKENIVTADGGGFRILFDIPEDADSEAKAKVKEEAEAFAQDLAELYYMAVDGSLTVAEPVEYDGNFPNATENANEKLREAKQERVGGVMPSRLPYMAICASCGVTIAHAYKPLRENKPSSPADNPSNHVCYPCRIKRAERKAGGDFLDKFEAAVKQASNTPESRTLKWVDDLDEDQMASFDPRGYVAYLVADGNRMGKLFGQCESAEQMTLLSKSLTDIVRASLAKPVVEIMRQNQESNTQGLMPILPLILGGDDLFVLLPAPWALDFARRFCLTYEENMKAVLEDKEKINLQPAQPPTMTAAVIICKNSYPYRLAHQRGEMLLKQAKRISKIVAQRDGFVPSMVHFEVILGSNLESGKEDEERYQSTLAPYWVRDDNLGQEALKWGTSLSELIKARYELRHLPNRRRGQLRELFSILPTKDKEQPDWHRQLEVLLERVGREATHKTALEQILVALGQAKTKQHGYWRSLRRIEQHIRAHGLLDLLNAWDFAYSLDKPRNEYKAKEG